MEILLDKLISSTDPIVLITIIVIYLVLGKKIALIKKDVERIDKSTNHRDEGQITMSQEVSQISTLVSKLYTKIEVQAAELSHVKTQVDLHRQADEKIFSELASNIELLAKKPAPRRTQKKS